METMVKQKTIKTEISLTGVGLHGERSKNDFKPAPVNNGFTFCSRFEGQPIIEADANYVVNTQRLI
jgi:UDP-3-O-[3-hydroxymyristoyl] N-acetylglucosamine deacetylase/3-hydroxyacyl-[acyl-carrier-protein] dehydratase